MVRNFSISQLPRRRGRLELELTAGYITKELLSWTFVLWPCSSQFTCTCVGLAAIPF